MFLEEWVHNRIRQEVKENAECQQYITEKDLKSITRKVIEDFQLFKLRKTLNHAYQESVFYQELFRKHGINPSDVKSLADLPKVPFTNPANLAEVPYKLLSVSLTKVDRVFTRVTSGTSGQPKKAFFTGNDLEVITDGMAAIMKTALSSGGLAAEGCVIQIFLANGTPMSQVNLVARGVEKMGGLPVAGDITVDTGEQIKAIQEARPVMLMGSAFRIYRITQEARQSHNLAKIGVKIIFITSEYLSPSMRRSLKDFWKAEVYHHYGMTEAGLAAAIECQAHDGFHFNEADFLFEVVDPATGEVLKESEEGELVFTTLSREGMPLIRYRTGDISRLIRDPCKCGASTLGRIGAITKRVGLIATIGRRKQIYPALFDDVLYSFPRVIDYRVFLANEGKKDCLTCKVELTEKEAGLEGKLTEAILNITPIRESLEANLLTQPRVEFVEPVEIKRSGRVKQRIIDKR
jgi:phenylacetate-coenzyme A ligase PaaK-like adenylate-forming protein